MGYELRIVAGRPSYDKDEDGSYYLHIIAVIELDKPGSESWVSELSKEDGKDRVYWYGWDGNTRVSTDRYGSELTTFDIDTVIEALKDDSERDPYYRFKFALDSLESLKKNSEDERIKVVFWSLNKLAVGRLPIRKWRTKCTS